MSDGQRVRLLKRVRLCFANGEVVELPGNHKYLVGGRDAGGALCALYRCPQTAEIYPVPLAEDEYELVPRQPALDAYRPAKLNCF